MHNPNKFMEREALNNQRSDLTEKLAFAVEHKIPWNFEKAQVTVEVRSLMTISPTTSTSTGKTWPPAPVDIGDVAVAVAAIKGVATLPLGLPYWWFSRSSIPAGGAAYDGQEVSRATYPDLFAAVAAGTLPVVTEAVWWVEPSKRNCFTLGATAGNFRLPDMNGAQVGSISQATLAGGSAAQVGTFHGELPNLKEQFGGTVGPFTPPSKLVKQSATEGASLQITGSSTWGANRLSFDANGVSPVFKDTATDVLPARVVGVWCGQLFGRVTNPGAVDGATLATRMEAINTDLLARISAQIESGKWYRWNDPLVLALITWHSSMTAANTPPDGLRVRITKYSISIMGQFNGSFPAAPEMFRLKAAPFTGITAYSIPTQWFNVAANVALATSAINAVATPDLARCVVATTGTQTAYNGKIEVIFDY